MECVVFQTLYIINSHCLNTADYFECWIRAGTFLFGYTFLVQLDHPGDIWVIPCQFNTFLDVFPRTPRIVLKFGTVVEHGKKKTLIFIFFISRRI